MGSGPLAEQNTGTVTSSALTAPMVPSFIQWYAAGWSGPTGDGLNRFEILDSTQSSVLATIAAPLTDNWQLQAVDLGAIGVNPGDTFFFRGVDGSTGTGFAWLAIDNMQFAPIPEPSSMLLVCVAGGLAVEACRRRVRSRSKRAKSAVRERKPGDSISRGHEFPSR